MKQQIEIEEKLLKIQVRVYEPQERDNYKMITLNKTKTIRELIKIIQENSQGSKFSAAKDDFCGADIKDIDTKNIRLRAYDPKLKIKLGVFEDSTDSLGNNPFE